MIKETISSIKNTVFGKEDQDYQLIWLYRLCLLRKQDECEEIAQISNSPLIKILDSEFEDSDIFENSNFGIDDLEQLKLFKFIASEKFASAQNKEIDGNKLNPFRY